VPVKADVVVFPLEKADEALAAVRAGKLEGAAVLQIRCGGSYL
jgi:D-arabinose 1-dehydrogenase-like Zn-dependent alcohol dehydrogenase